MKSIYFLAFLNFLIEVDSGIIQRDTSYNSLVFSNGETELGCESVTCYGQNECRMVNTTLCLTKSTNGECAKQPLCMLTI
ncbi:unnamed protein product [Caenorhabditis angaria]|uniref:Uncharacterized protein n=1 Tax=Caenorhabditis angaria TaxID=860376 RepID=A0A9P1N5R4_9PELO|nr:unnamed protein product [Caenorhabditis angaria]